MDIEMLVELATKAILERLSSRIPRVVTFGDIPEGLIAGAEVTAGKSCADIDGCDYIVLSAAAFKELHGGAGGAAKPPEQAAPCAQAEGGVIDLRGKRLIHERDLRDANAARGHLVRVDKKAIITALAHDYAKGIGAKITKE